MSKSSRLFKFISFILLVSSAVVLNLLGFITEANADNNFFEDDVPTCSVKFGTSKISFAHCSDKYRDYKTAIIALHGWNGSCQLTFGTDKGSLFSITGQDRHYDWDCLDYNSHSWTIDKNVVALEERVLLLKEKGYENILFLTHSTGGIILLEYLLNQVLDKNNDVRVNVEHRLKALPRIRAASIWSAPIYGLRKAPGLVSGVLQFFSNFFGAKEEILGDLFQGSEYLDSLRDRLDLYRIWYENLTPFQRSQVRVDITFLQGQREDRVVEKIPSDPLPVWLAPKNSRRFINTEIKHLDSVSHAAEVTDPKAHRWPSLVVDSMTFKNAPFAPRYDIFKSKTPHHAVHFRQQQIVRSLSNFALSDNQDAAEPAMNLLMAILNSDFIHYVDVDEAILSELIGILKGKIDYSSTFISSAGSVLLQLEDFNKYFKHGKYNSPAQGRTTFESQIIELLELILKVLVDENSEQIASLTKSMQTASLNILKETQVDSNRLKILGFIANQIKNPRIKPVFDANSLDYISNIYIANVKHLPQETRDAFGQVYLSAFENNNDLSVKAFELINSEISIGNREFPLWQSLGSTQLYNYLQKEIGVVERWDNLGQQPLLQQDIQTNLLKFGINSIRSVGLSGRNNVDANYSFRNVEIAIEKQPKLLSIIQEYNASSSVNIFRESNNERKLNSLLAK